MAEGGGRIQSREACNSKARSPLLGNPSLEEREPETSVTWRVVNLSSAHLYRAFCFLWLGRGKGHQSIRMLDSPFWVEDAIKRSSTVCSSPLPHPQAAAPRDPLSTHKGSAALPGVGTGLAPPPLLLATLETAPAT